MLSGSVALRGSNYNPPPTHKIHDMDYMCFTHTHHTHIKAQSKIWIKRKREPEYIAEPFRAHVCAVSPSRALSEHGVWSDALIAVFTV